MFKGESLKCSNTIKLTLAITRQEEICVLTTVTITRIFLGKNLVSQSTCSVGQQFRHNKKIRYYDSYK